VLQFAGSTCSEFGQMRTLTNQHIELQNEFYVPY
jgi:hypothetical protein